MRQSSWNHSSRLQNCTLCIEPAGEDLDPALSQHSTITIGSTFQQWIVFFLAFHRIPTHGLSFQQPSADLTSVSKNESIIIPTVPSHVQVPAGQTHQSPLSRAHPSSCYAASITTSTCICTFRITPPPTTSNRSAISNDKISGISLWHLDHRISWVRTVCCRQLTGFGRIARGPASVGSWCIHRHTSDSKRRLIWR